VYNKLWEVVIKMSFINPNNGYRDYLLNREEETEELEDYGIFVYFEEDEYARYDVRNVITETPKVKMMNELNRLPPLGLFRESETLKVRVFGYFNRALLEKVKEYNRRGRKFIFEVKSEEDLKLITKLVKNNDEENEVKVFEMKDYQDELEWCQEKVIQWSGGELSNNLKYKLSYYMKNNHDKWNDIKLMFDIEGTVDEETVAEYFDDMDSYNTEDWIDSVLMGNRKGKNFVILDYLITIKELKPYMVLTNIKDRIEDYLELINLYDKGVIHGKETTETQLVKRSEFLGVELGENLLSDRRNKMIDNLTVLKRGELEFAYSEVLKLMTSKNKYTIDVKDLVYFIDVIRLSKSKERIDEINSQMFRLSKMNKKKRRK